MGNSQHRLYALVPPNSDRDYQQCAPPSYSAVTGQDRNSSLSALLDLDRFKISNWHSTCRRKFHVTNYSGQRLFKVKHVKSSHTRGDPLREAYHITDNAGAIVFIAMESVSSHLQTERSYLGCVYFECHGRTQIHVTIYDNLGNIIIKSSTESARNRMLFADGQCVGSFQCRNSGDGSKGYVLQQLNLNLKACILFSTVLASLYCHYRRR